MSRAFLLDTSVLSLLAPGRTSPDAHIIDWLRRNGERLYISTVTIAEIEQGIRKLYRSGGTERANKLAIWLDTLIESGEDRILPLDISAARQAGMLSDQAMAAGRHPGFADVAIAAIAQSHDLTILTTNGRHFEPLGVDHIDPQIALP